MHILPNPTMPEDNLPKLAKSQKMTYREWPDSGRCLTKNSQIPTFDKLELAWPRKIKYRDLVSPASQLAKSQKRI